jgi:hypothetical protein
MSRVMSPAGYLIASSATAGAALLLMLFWTRPGMLDSQTPESALQLTPERAAEGFIDAYLSEDYARAAGFALEPFASAVRARPRHDGRVASANTLSWLLQETHMLRGDRLRFVGVLLRPGQDEGSGWPVTLTLERDATRFRVEALHWPKGPPRP